MLIMYVICFCCRMKIVVAMITVIVKLLQKHNSITILASLMKLGM